MHQVCRLLLVLLCSAIKFVRNIALVGDGDILNYLTKLSPSQHMATDK